MAHFRTEDWVDFDRQCVTPETGARMQEHLDAGCGSCQDALQAWRKVRETARNVNQLGPSADAVRIAKSLFHVIPPQTSRYRHVEVARLATPVFPFQFGEGLRSAKLSNGHFLFQRDDLLLDVQVDMQESGIASLAGQMMNPVRPTGKFAGKNISLMHDNIELGRAITNQFGEFQLEFKPVEDAMLVIEVEDESLLVTPLPSLFPAGTSTGPGRRDPQMD